MKKPDRIRSISLDLETEMEYVNENVTLGSRSVTLPSSLTCEVYVLITYIENMQNWL